MCSFLRGVDGSLAHDRLPASAARASSAVLGCTPGACYGRRHDREGVCMLPSQRALFDIPREVCYLNAASWSPLPLAVQEAGRAGVARKGQPWTLDPAFAGRQHERARRAAAALINADAEDIALISSVAYGVATAGKLAQIPSGTRVLV